MTLDQILAAMEANLAGHVAYVQAGTPGMQVEDAPDLLLVDSGLHSDTFNKILRARMPPATAPRRVQSALGHFRRELRPFTWWLGPLSKPENLSALLQREGLRASESELGMVAARPAIPARVDLPAGLEIRRVRTLSDLRHFAAISAANWDPPDPAVALFFERAAPLILRDSCPMRLYLGAAGGEPAAAGEVFLGGGVAGIHMVSTARAFRRRGIGSAVTWHCAAEGIAAGMDHVVLQASAEGEPVYRRLGFEAVCRFVEYAPA